MHLLIVVKHTLAANRLFLMLEITITGLYKGSYGFYATVVVWNLSSVSYSLKLATYLYSYGYS